MSAGDAVSCLSERLAGCEDIIGHALDVYPRPLLSHLAELQTRLNTAKSQSPELARALNALDIQDLVSPQAVTMPTTAMLEVALSAEDELKRLLSTLQSIAESQKVLDLPTLQSLPSSVAQFADIGTQHMAQLKSCDTLGQRVMSLTEAYTTFIASANEIFIDIDRALTSSEKRLQQVERLRRQANE